MDSKGLFTFAPYAHKTSHKEVDNEFRTRIMSLVVTLLEFCANSTELYRENLDAMVWMSSTAVAFTPRWVLLKHWQQPETRP